MSDDLAKIKAKIFNLINKENNTSLNPNDFEISLPSPFSSSLHPNVNTQLTITPLPGTGYQGAVTIYYKRIDFNDLFSNLYYELNPTDALHLSDIVPILNNAFGTDILRSDYIDTDIPPYNATYPNRRRIVTIEAQPNSYFYIGSHDIILGPKATPIVEDNIVYKHYLHVDTLNPKEKLICLDTNGSLVSDFSFLSNARDIETFNIDYIVKTKDKFFLIGQFKLKYLLDTEVSIEAPTIIINHLGVIINHANDVLFSNTKLVPTYDLNYYYTINEENTTNPNAIYKYNANGELVAYIAAIDYIPSLIALDKQNRLYTVSKPYEGVDPFLANTNSKLVRLDRLLPNGEIDTSFNTIYFKASDPSYYPLRIMDIVFSDSDGFYLVVEPTYGLDIAYIYPVINNVPLIANTSGNTTFSWNPILRFHSDGQWDSNFKPALKTQLDKTIFIQPGPHLTCKVLHLNQLNDSERIVLFSYRANPATGFNHVQPISFDYRGNLILDNLTSYYHHPKWVMFGDSNMQTNGKLLAFGSMQFITNTGEYSSVQYAYVRYNPDTSLDKVIYQSTNTPILNAYLVETNV